MNWGKANFGTLGFHLDYYIPASNGGGMGNATQNNINKTPFSEQIRHKENKEPRIVITKENGATRLQKFYEWEQFLDYVDWRGEESRRRSQMPESQLFFAPTLTQNFEAAMHLARYGWIDCIPLMQSMEKLPLIQFQPSTTLTHRYDIAGGAVNIGRYLSGVPDHMRRMNTTDKFSIPQKIIKLVIYCGPLITTKPQYILEQGYKIYQIIDTLEKANIRTEIIITTLSHEKYNQTGTPDSYEVHLTLKKTEERIYPEKLLFVLAHPSFFRRLILSEHEKNSRDIIEKFHFKYEPSFPGYCGSLNDFEHHLSQDSSVWFFNTEKPLHTSDINNKLARIFAKHYDNSR